MGIVLVALGCVLLGDPRSHADDWTRWRGPNRNGISNEKDWKIEALQGRLKIQWKVQVGAGHSSVAVTQKYLYTMGNHRGKDIITCLDVETGKPVWRLPYRCAPGGFPGPRSTPVLDDGHLYSLSRDGLALCLDAGTGKVKWQRNFKKEFKAKNVDYGFTGSPLVLGNAVYYNACQNGIALDKTTGKQIWASKPGPHGYATPVPVKFKERDCVAIFSATALYLVETGGGNIVGTISWRTDFDANAADPLSFEGKLFFTSGWERGCALYDLSGDSARQIWQRKTLRCQLSSPIYLNGHIYGIDDNTPNGRLTCIDADKGKLQWSQKGAFENMMVAGGRIIAMDKRGFLIVAEANPTRYKELVRTQVFRRQGRYWTAPVLANGRIYCRSSKGVLVCIDVR